MKHSNSSVTPHLPKRNLSQSSIKFSQGSDFGRSSMIQPSLKKSSSQIDLLKEEEEEQTHLNNSMMKKVSTNFSINPHKSQIIAHIKHNKPQYKRMPPSHFLNPQKNTHHNQSYHQTFHIDDEESHTYEEARFIDNSILYKGDFHQRNDYKKNKMERYIQNQRNNKYQEELKELKDKPTLSQNTQKIIRDI